MAEGLSAGGVLLVGDHEHLDFEPLRRWLARRTHSLQTAPKANALEVVALCQSRPGQFSQAQVEALFGAHPLAKVIVVLGSWCEGELRSGAPCHGIERVYWYEAIGRLESLCSEIDPIVSQRTETLAERIELRTRRSPVSQSPSEAVIVTVRRDEYETLAELCRLVGLTPHWQRAVGTMANVTPALVLLAIDDLGSLDSPQVISQLRSQWPAAKFVALLNFPRRDESLALETAGCDFVVGQPVLLSDLLGCCQSLWGDHAKAIAAN